MLLDYLTYWNRVCLPLKLKIEQIRYHKLQFHIFIFFLEIDFFFIGNVRGFQRIFDAAILDKLDLKWFTKNILRFIAFDLIFHMEYFFNG